MDTDIEGGTILPYHISQLSDLPLVLHLTIPASSAPERTNIYAHEHMSSEHDLILHFYVANKYSEY